MTARILQVVASTDRRGAETFAIALATVLQRRGLFLETVALAPGVTGGLDVPTLGTKPLGGSSLSALRRRARSADVVVGHGSSTLPAGALALAGTATPFVYRNIGDPSYWSSSGLRKWRTTLALRRAQRLVALSGAAAHTYERDYGIRQERICVIPTGVDDVHHRPATTAERDRARASFGIGGDALVACAIGALSPEKAVDDAIRAVGGTPRVDVLLVVGDGPLRGDLEGLAREVAPGRVRFLGQLSDLHAVYSAVDVVVSPSRTEGLPAVLIEAALSGVPVVATDVGYVDEIVIHDLTGFLVRPNDPVAIADALGRLPELPDDVAARARENARAKFGMDVVADRWATLFEELRS